MTSIRPATSLDSEDIREVHLCAFPDIENRKVSTLALDLLSEDTKPETISLVAEDNGAVVGHVAFSPVFTDDDRRRTGYILAPLGIRPEYQKRGIGSKLIENGMARLSKKGVDVVFVYGDPGYYGRFGFSAEVASGYTTPYELQHPFGWLAVDMDNDALTVATAKIACVAPLRDPELW